MWQPLNIFCICPILQYAYNTMFIYLHIYASTIYSIKNIFNILSKYVCITNKIKLFLFMV